MWKAFAFGAVVAAVIGPIALLIFGIAARRGFASGASAALGAALADLLYALAAFLAGALLLPLVAGHEQLVRTASGLLLVAVGAYMLAVAAGRTGQRAVPVRAASSYFLPVFLLTLVNPMTLVAFAGIVAQLPVAGSPAKAVPFALALASGSATVGLGFAAAGAALGATLPGPGWQRAIAALAAFGVVVFGIAGLLQA